MKAFHANALIARTALLASIATSLVAPLASAQTARSRPLVIGVLSYEAGESTATDSISRNAERGLALGIDEAQQTAELFGRRVKESRTVVKPGDDALKAARIMARTSMMSAIVVTNRELVSAAQEVAHDYPVIFIRSLPSPEPPTCSDLIFTLYGGAGPIDASAFDSKPAAAQAAVSQRVSLWHSSLEKFGARELNDRYHTRWHTGMTSEAWAAWMAVKILSEASLRKQTVEPFLLSDYIKTAEFDGHKGWPLTFRAQDHALRQPYYMVLEAGSKTSVQPLPAGDRSETKSAAAVLDELNPPDPGAHCSSSRR